LTGYAVVAIVPLFYLPQTFGNNIIGNVIAIVTLSKAVLVAIVSFFL
jgi:hypothetical protein